MPSQFREPLHYLGYCIISVSPPFIRKKHIPLNEYGLPIKKYYTTGDICKVLTLDPDTFRARIRAGFYTEPLRLGDKRRFSKNELINIINVSNHLIIKGVFKSGRVIRDLNSKFNKK